MQEHLQDPVRNFEILGSGLRKITIRHRISQKFINREHARRYVMINGFASPNDEGLCKRLTDFWDENDDDYIIFSTEDKFGGTADDHLMKIISFADWVHDTETVMRFNPQDYILTLTEGEPRKYLMNIVVGISLGGWILTLLCHRNSTVKNSIGAAMVVAPAYGFLMQKTRKFLHEGVESDSDERKQQIAELLSGNLIRIKEEGYVPMMLKFAKDSVASEIKLGEKFQTDVVMKFFNGSNDTKVNWRQTAEFSSNVIGENVTAEFFLTQGAEHDFSSDAAFLRLCTEMNNLKTHPTMGQNLTFGLKATEWRIQISNAIDGRRKKITHLKCGESFDRVNIAIEHSAGSCE